MTLPNSEPLPNDINELPPARQRLIRRHPRLASVAERQLFLASLLSLTTPNLDFFFLALVSPLAGSAALYFDDITLLVLAIALFPFLKPIFDLALLPASKKTGPGFKSLLSLVILLCLTFAAGALAGSLSPSAHLVNLRGLYRFSQLYWVDLAILVGSTLLIVLIILRKGRLPYLAGILLTYLILLPLITAGFTLTTGHAQLWPGALFVALIHLGLAIIVALLAFFILGFVPKNSMGWLLLAIILTISLAFFTINMRMVRSAISQHALQTPTITAMPQISFTTTQSTSTPLPAATHTLALSPTNTTTQTATLTATQPPSQTPSPEPTSFFAVVETGTGAVIRESPTTSALVITYANDGDLIEIIDTFILDGHSRWFQVRTVSGDTGWILASLVNTQTPSPDAP